jgi:glycosyltransferase involved in cell wall biosynthesis
VSTPANQGRRALLLIVESGTDVRMVEGLAERFDLRVLARRIPGGVEISRPPAAAVPIELGGPSRAAFAARVARHLLARRGELEAVVVQGYGAAALAANLAGRLAGLPVTMLVCSPVERYYRCRREAGDPAKPYRGWELAGLTALARLNARLGRGYVVLSDHLAEVVRGHGTRRPVEVVPVYGVDLDRFSPAAEPPAAIRRRRGLPDRGRMIFFSSRIAPEKDAEALLEAFRRALASGRDLWLLHRSGGYRELAARAERLGIGARVIATDAVHPERELPDDYRSSDLCVQASREEGLGFSVLEAMACGVPVVATAVGGLTETVIDGETGWTYPAGDDAALERAICEALDRPDEARRRAGAGRRLVAAGFERGAVFDCFAATLARAANAARPAGIVEDTR